jgi:hypothetical protein
MQAYRKAPVRINMPIQIGPCTIKDQDGVVADLTLYTAVYLDVKCQGFAAQSPVSGDFYGDKTLGNVYKTSYIFTQEGHTTIQFYAVDGAGNKLYGDPVQFTVYKNVEDMTLSDTLDK